MKYILLMTGTKDGCRFLQGLVGEGYSDPLRLFDQYQERSDQIRRVRSNRRPGHAASG